MIINMYILQIYTNCNVQKLKSYRLYVEKIIAADGYLQDMHSNFKM